ncbi:hypothetical protein AB0I68_06860 [Streptomyces sp. NPDC050448]|uniref:hypothetical protein n=1 Tax=Streptomyces sp. NPDC050448 TaxID=3155404 RepID=UPI00342FD50A
MPTFEQLLNAKLGPMDTAVTQWTAMIAKLAQLKTDASAMKTTPWSATRSSAPSTSARPST